MSARMKSVDRTTPVMFLSGRSRMKTLDSSLGEKVPLLGRVRRLAMDQLDLLCRDVSDC